jgi:hypothetical protein
MPLTDAVALDNFMPKASYVELRGGSTAHTASANTDILTEAGLDLLTETGDIVATEDVASTIVGAVKTLAPYNAPSGTNKLFAFTEAAIYDVSTSGTVGASLLARTDGKHQYLQFGDGTTNWLIACNGVDSPAYYNGTSFLAVTAVTSPALIGVTSSRLVVPMKFKGRLMFLERDSLTLWYLPAGVAGGTLLPFDVSADCKRGGFLMAGASWTRDAGEGQDDVLVLITSEGEALVYQGDNPSSSANWALVGSFYVGKPLGRRCLAQYGGDIIILTENGVFLISEALQSAVINYEQALSDKIIKAFTDAGRSYGSIFGWEATIYPAQQALIVNVPVAENGIHYQYVMNTQTKAWCRFTGWNAETFCVFNKELYFSNDGTVYKAWVGTADGTNAIPWYGKQAYSQHGVMGVKRPSIFRPYFRANGPVNYATGIDTDFDDQSVNGGSQVLASTSQPIWGQNVWGSGVWSGGDTTIKQWGSTATYPGFWLSGKIQGQTNNTRLQWMASDMVFEPGGVL